MTNKEPIITNKEPMIRITLTTDEGQEIVEIEKYKLIKLNFLKRVKEQIYKESKEYIENIIKSTRQNFVKYKKPENIEMIENLNESLSLKNKKKIYKNNILNSIRQLIDKFTPEDFSFEGTISSKGLEDILLKCREIEYNEKRKEYEKNRLWEWRV